MILDTLKKKKFGNSILFVHEIFSSEIAVVNRDKYILKELATNVVHKGPRFQLFPKIKKKIDSVESQ